MNSIIAVGDDANWTIVERSTMRPKNHRNILWYVRNQTLSCLKVASFKLCQRFSLIFEMLEEIQFWYPAHCAPNIKFVIMAMPAISSMLYIYTLDMPSIGTGKWQSTRDSARSTRGQHVERQHLMTDFLSYNILMSRYHGRDMVIVQHPSLQLNI